MDSVEDRRGWGLLPPKEVRERKEWEWAEDMAKAEAIGDQVASLRERLPAGWTSCELEEHIEEVRTRNDELSRLLTERPFDSEVLDSVWLHVEAVRELLEHCEGLHAPDVLVRAIEA